MANVQIKVSATGVSGAIKSIAELKKNLIELSATQTNVVKSTNDVRDALKNETSSIDDNIKALIKELNTKKELISVNNKLRGSERRDGTRVSSNMSDLGSGSGIRGMSSSFSLANLAVLALSSAFHYAVSAVRTFGHFVLNDFIKPQLKADTQYVQLANRSVGQLSVADAKKAAKINEIAYNMTQEESIKVMGAFMAHGGEGSGKLTPQALKFVSMIAKGTGADAETVANTLGGLRLPGESFEETQAKYLSAQKLGQLGNVPLEELAGKSKALKSISTRLTGDNGEKFATANAMLQIIDPQMKSPAQAVFSIDALISSITSKKGHPHFKEAISNVGGVQSVDLAKAIEIMLRKGSSKENLQALGINTKQGQRAIEGLNPLYEKFVKEDMAKGMSLKEAESEAAKQVVHRLKELSDIHGELADAEKKASDAMNTSGEKVSSVWHNVVSQLNTPEMKEKIDHFVNVFVSNSDKMANAAELFTNTMISFAESLQKHLGPVFDVWSGTNKYEKWEKTAEGEVEGKVVNKGTKTEFRKEDMSNDEIEAYLRSHRHDAAHGVPGTPVADEIKNYKRQHPHYWRLSDKGDEFEHVHGEPPEDMVSSEVNGQIVYRQRGMIEYQGPNGENFYRKPDIEHGEGPTNWKGWEERREDAKYQRNRKHFEFNSSVVGGLETSEDTLFNPLHAPKETNPNAENDTKGKDEAKGAQKSLKEMATAAENAKKALDGFSFALANKEAAILPTGGAPLNRNTPLPPGP